MTEFRSEGSSRVRTMKQAKTSVDNGILVLAGIGGCVVGLALLLYGVLVSGWVLTVLWGWFVEPAFHLPTLSLPVAIGAAAMVRLLTYVDTSDLQKKESASDERWSRLVGALLSPWVTLGLGWVVHFFV